MQIKYFVMALLLIVLMATGCAGHHQRRPHGGKLSDAMEKASDDYEGSRDIHTRDTVPGHYHAPEHLSEPDPSDAQNVPVEKKQSDYTDVLGLNIGTGLLEDQNFYRLNHMDLSYGFLSKEKERLEGFIGLGQLLVDETSDLNQPIDEAWLFSAGFCYKRYTTPRHTFLGKYFILGLSFDYLAWSYENDITVDGRTVSGDGMYGLELFGGIGFNLAQFKNYHLGLEVIPSMVLWDAYTDEGFDNDVFGTLYLLKLRFTMSCLSKSKLKSSNDK